MRRTKNMIGWSLAWALALAPAAGCRFAVTPAVRYRAATYGEPYVFYRATTPYVYMDGTVWSYDGYYLQYYGSTYVVPPAPRHEGPIPPPPVLTGPGYGRSRTWDDDG